MATQNTFRLIIASVGETKYDGAAYSVTVPGTGGVMTLLANHEPIVTTLKKGHLTVKSEGGEQKIFDLDAGILEASGGRVVVLL